MKSESELSRIVSALAMAQTHDEEEEIGRSELSSLLFHASPALLEQILKMARRNNRMRRCLSAARYYAGLRQETCDRIDTVLKAPFPAASRPGK